ncbi:MAG TPA: hypothetical protein VN721_14780 [Flavipsychrobacter sp.]|nr:hypothetical protein [Flavipsychrobacter sp.]
MRRFITSLLLALTCYTSYAQTETQNEAPWWVQQFRISAGLYLPVNNTVLKVDGNNGNTGTEINFENDLGFAKSSATFIGDVQFRISRRSRIAFSYYNIARSSVHTLDKDINFGDTTYNVNTTVHATFNTAIYQVSYGYSILSRPTYEAGVAIGAHIIGGHVALELEGNTTTTPNSFNFTAPLPDLEIWGGYAISRHFALQGSLGYLGLTIGSVHGSIFTYDASLMYNIVDNLSVALGYSGLNFEVNAKINDNDSHFKWGYNGLTLKASYSFGKSW